jgi:hypothetical protein
MAKENFVAMGQAGLSGRARAAARPLARVIARRTGRSEADILALMGGVLLAMALISFLRTVDTVVKAGRSGHVPADDGAAGAGTAGRD